MTPSEIVTDVSPVQPLNTLFENDLTLPGMTIEARDEHSLNA